MLEKANRFTDLFAYTVQKPYSAAGKCTPRSYKASFPRSSFSNYRSRKTELQLILFHMQENETSYISQLLKKNNSIFQHYKVIICTALKVDAYTGHSQHATFSTEARDQHLQKPLPKELPHKQLKAAVSIPKRFRLCNDSAHLSKHL